MPFYFEPPGRMSDQHEMVRRYSIEENSESNGKHNDTGFILTESWMKVYQSIGVHHSGDYMSTFGNVASVISRKIENILQENRMHCN